MDSLHRCRGLASGQTVLAILDQVDHFALLSSMWTLHTISETVYDNGDAHCRAVKAR